MGRKQQLSASSMLRYLQGWIGVVGFMALGNTVSCFMGHEFLSERLYTKTPKLVSGLSARLFGSWTLLAACLRIYCSFHIRNIAVYNITFVSFFLAVVHFASEVLYYKTCTIQSPGVIAHFVVSGVSMVWMGIGYSYINRPDRTNPREQQMKRRFQDLLEVQKKCD